MSALARRGISTAILSSRVTASFARFPKTEGCDARCRLFSLYASRTKLRHSEPSRHPTTTVAHFSVRRRRTNNRDGVRAPPPPTPSSLSALQPESEGVSLEGENVTRLDLRFASRGLAAVPTDFEPRAKRFLGKIHSALLPLVPLNDNMIVTLGVDEVPDDDDDEAADPNELTESVVYGPFLLIDLGPVHGQYTMTADVLQGVILFQSPISGQRVYAMHPTSDGEWSCVEDGHNLEGILVRDLIRQIQGIPNL